MESERLYDLIERLGILVRAELRSAAADEGLATVQLEVIRYLAACNRYSDTPAGVTEWLGATKGTVSQTLAALERKGLVTKRADPRDGRVVHCALTDAGSALLARIWPPAALRAASDLPPAQREALERSLEHTLVRLQAAHGGRSFGVCGTCRHFHREADGARCGLTSEPLGDRDAAAICREHAA